MIGVGITGEAVGNSVLQNSIFNNDSLGIDLWANGYVEANDILDGDSGPNQIQNLPFLFQATELSGEVSAGGTLYSAASTSYSLDFYASATCDPSGYGEGQQWLGEAPVTTFGSGVVNFIINLEKPMPPGMPYLTATATDPDSNTSEFSGCLLLLRYIYLPFVRR